MITSFYLSLRENLILTRISSILVFNVKVKSMNVSPTKRWRETYVQDQGLVMTGPQSHAASDTLITLIWSLSAAARDRLSLMLFSQTVKSCSEALMLCLLAVHFRVNKAFYVHFTQKPVWLSGPLCDDLQSQTVARFPGYTPSTTQQVRSTNQREPYSRIPWPEALVSTSLKTQHPKQPLQEVSDNLMLCSPSTLAHLDWWCNGNWRFITPAGVANHRRQEAWGKDEHRLTECPLLTTSDWIHTGQLARLVPLPTGTLTDTHLVCLLQHNGRLGRMCGRHSIFPPPFLTVRWFLPRTCARLKTDAHSGEAIMEK